MLQVHLLGKFGDRPQHGDHIDDLEGALLGLEDGLLPGDAQHRERRQVCVGNSCCRIRGARAQCCQTHSCPSCTGTPAWTSHAWMALCVWMTQSAGDHSPHNFKDTQLGAKCQEHAYLNLRYAWQQQFCWAKHEVVAWHSSMPCMQLLWRLQPALYLGNLHGTHTHNSQRIVTQAAADL